MATKRYSVTGDQPVLDTLPGETFEAEIPADQEEFLISIGAIRVVSNDPKHDKRIGRNKKQAPKAKSKAKESPVEQDSPPTLPEDQQRD
jgi:hypothetical protein